MMYTTTMVMGYSTALNERRLTIYSFKRMASNFDLHSLKHVSPGPAILERCPEKKVYCTACSSKENRVCNSAQV